MKRTLLISAVLCGSMLLSGCVTGRRTIDLPVPQLGGAAGAKGTISVGTIEDARVFENQPKAASTPSFNGEVTSVSKVQLGTMIGRQRNTFGKALGDIALPNGDSVAERVRLLLEEGLRRRGYVIATDAATAHTATVSIDEFWAWFTPGMWSVSFEAKVACKITVTRGGKAATFSAKGYGRNQAQVASDANWQLAYKRAFDDFLVDLDAELTKVGL